MNFNLREFFNILLHPKFYFPLVLLALLGVLPVLARNPFYEDLIVSSFFYGTLAAAWNLVGGFAGQISLGHTAFFGIGAYTSTLLYLNFSVSPWLGMLAGACLSILVAIGVGVPCFRLKSHFFALATIAIGEVLRMVASYWTDLTKGGVGLLIPFKPGIENFMFKSKLPYAYIALAMMLLMILVSYVIRNSRFGFYLISLREDQDAAESLGVYPVRVKLLVTMISAALTAISGFFYAHYILFLDPPSVFSIDVSIHFALLSIIGGMGTALGPIAGSFLMTPLDGFLSQLLGGGIRLMIYGFVLLLVVLVVPQGIVGTVQKWWNRRHQAS